MEGDKKAGAVAEKAAAAVDQSKEVAAGDVSLKELSRRLNDFAKERDWEQYHSPRNLLLAMVCTFSPPRTFCSLPGEDVFGFLINSLVVTSVDRESRTPPNIRSAKPRFGQVGCMVPPPIAVGASFSSCRLASDQWSFQLLSGVNAY